jgi:hypothetical protein
MAQPTVKEAKAIQQILKNFGQASGMDLNTTKSKILFFHTPLTVHMHITRNLSFQKIEHPSKYLGAPLTSNNLNISSWEELLSKLNKN